jgi:hypothetical protein
VRLRDYSNRRFNGYRLKEKPSQESSNQGEIIMGYARWSPEDWDAYTDRLGSKSRDEIFTNRRINAAQDPKNIKVRESCDSDRNPQSTPIIVAVDDTGSMGMLAEVLIRKGLGVLLEGIYDRKPVTDPHVMCMAVGDAWFDSAPLQVTQFEADLRLAEQLTNFYIEGGGGGNAHESYHLPWYFAATRTKCDAMLKRNKKGYLFTVGDEPPPPVLTAKHAMQIFGDSIQRDLKSDVILGIASRSWEIFHIVVQEGSYCRSADGLAETQQKWKKLLGQRVLQLPDHRDLAELILTTIEVNEGREVSTAISVAGNQSRLIQTDIDNPFMGI